MCTVSHVRLFAAPWTIACQAPLSMGFSRQEYCNGLPFPPPGDLLELGIKPWSPACQTDSLPLSDQRTHRLNVLLNLQQCDNLDKVKVLRIFSYCITNQLYNDDFLASSSCFLVSFKGKLKKTYFRITLLDLPDFSFLNLQIYTKMGCSLHHETLYVLLLGI